MLCLGSFPRESFKFKCSLKLRQVRPFKQLKDCFVVGVSDQAFLYNLSIDPQYQPTRQLNHPANQPTTQPPKQQQQVKRNGNLKCLPASLTCRQLTIESRAKGNPWTTSGTIQYGIEAWSRAHHGVPYGRFKLLLTHVNKHATDGRLKTAVGRALDVCVRVCAARGGLSVPATTATTATTTWLKHHSN